MVFIFKTVVIVSFMVCYESVHFASYRYVVSALLVIIG